ncbi:MAG: extracellular solute-binding protein [Treponema sp.]|nr:extracellular solute-binding protein [Treponema sp.]
MKCFRKAGIAILIFAVTTAFVFGSGGSQPSTMNAATTANSNFNPTGYPIVKEKITLTGFGNQNVNHRAWDELTCFTEYEKLSNIHIQWTTAPDQGWAERKNLMFASGDYPDIFYRCGLTVAEIINYGSKGILLPLNDLIDQYGVNIKECINELPDIGRALKMPDGNIYTLPSKSSVEQNASQKNWINGRWLKTLNLNVPTTLDEFEAMLIAFKTKDPNGNGKADELPYTDQGNFSIFRSTYSSFGMGNLSDSQFNNYIDLGPDNKIRLFAITDNYRQQLEWVAKLYSEGLIDPESLTQGLAQFTAKGDQGLIGAAFYNGNIGIFGQKYMNDYISGPPLKGKSGDPAVYNNIQSLFGIGAFAASKQTKYPAEVMRWIDYWYSYEGTLLLRLGQEGVTYTKNADGSYELTDLIRANPQGLAIPQAFGYYGAIASVGAGCPEFTRDVFEKARLEPIVFTAYEILKPYLNVVARPLLSFTTAEQQQLNPIISDMITYIDEARGQFMTGRRPLSQWDAYVADIKRMGADRYVSIYQASWDRYMGK